MNSKILNTLFLISYPLIGHESASIKIEVMLAPHVAADQWQAVNNLWNTSFYNAYKDLPFDQVDVDIKDGSRQALMDYLQNRFDNYRRIAIQDSYFLMLAHKGEQLVGYSLYHTLAQQPTLHINHFAVDPNCQGQGVGKKLLDATKRAHPEIGALVLTTRIHNKQAQGFYKSQGFYQVTEAKGVGDFDPKYSVLLKKDLK